jgi:ferritin-like metal-binding protein YciE
MRTLKDLFLDELADMYDAENRVGRALPKMARAATCIELQKLLQAHAKESDSHVKKLERIFKSFGQPVRARKCEATVGLLKEGDEIVSVNKGSPALDAALISVAQKLKHYEIASYGCLREWSALMGNNKATILLQDMLDQEKTVNQALTRAARTRSNFDALSESAAMNRCQAEEKKTIDVARRTRPLKIGRIRLGRLGR